MKMATRLHTATLAMLGCAACAENAALDGMPSFVSGASAGMSGSSAAGVAPSTAGEGAAESAPTADASVPAMAAASAQSRPAVRSRSQAQAAAGSGGSPASAPNSAATPSKSTESCEMFKPQTLPHGAVIGDGSPVTTHGVPAVVEAPTVRPAIEPLLPEVCIVRGTIKSSDVSTITFAVELPAPGKWNGKTLTIGGGGADGFIPTDDIDFYQALVGPTAHDYVKISSNSGHWQDSGYIFAEDDAGLRNHATEANHMVLEVGTELAKQYYGKAPSRRYMLGHSNGGRSAFAATQRHPLDYDGVIAMEPALKQQAHQINWGGTSQRVYATRWNWVSPAKAKLFAAHEIEACDEGDGLEDGIIANYEACKYTGEDLLCPSNVDSDTCLTDGQIQSLRDVYRDQDRLSRDGQPFVFPDGTHGYRRYPHGGAATTDFDSYAFGTSFDDSSQWGWSYVAPILATAYAENLPTTPVRLDDKGQPRMGLGMVPMFDDSVIRAHSPFVADHRARWLRSAALMDTTDPDLREFVDHGGKLLLWYGTSDTCVSIYQAADYVQSMQQFMGGADKTRSFFRFLTTAAIGHDLNGPGAGSVDLLGALEAWVERGEGPDQLVSTRYAVPDDAPQTAALKLQNLRVKFERPLCEYPKYAHYKGAPADPASASSFDCQLPVETK